MGSSNHAAGNLAATLTRLQDEITAVRHEAAAAQRRAEEADVRATRADERATRADERATQLAAERLPSLVRRGIDFEGTNGLSRMSRREALTKGALAGAAGLAAVAITRPTPVEAAYSLQGDAVNNASSPTSLVAQPSYPNVSYVLRADASPTNNATQAIDGLQGQGAGVANGVRAWGGQLNGIGVFSQGGFSPANTTNGGVGVVAIAGGTTPHGLADGQGLNATGSFAGPGVYATGGAASGGPGVVASAGGAIFTSGQLSHQHGTGVMAIGSTAGTAGGTGWGLFAAGPGAPNLASVASTGVVALGGPGAPGLFAAGGPLTGQIQLAPAASAGPPVNIASQRGEVWVDNQGTFWICTAPANLGLPPVWAPLQQGGIGNALFTAISTSQYTLVNSDGSAWHDVDATNLSLTITPRFKCYAILSGNSDLWTSTAGFNQDLGIMITGGAYPTVAGQPEAWKESGGFAGTFSPNAAFVETVKPLAAGTTYTIKLQWKANKNAAGATIWAGAGPIGGAYSPTRLTALLIVSQ